MPLAVEWTNLHQILRSLYADMLPLCSDMMGIAKGLAGLGALFFIAYRVWKSLAAAEPIEVFPLLRPFVLGLCIMAFPTLVLGPLNGLLSPISKATSHLVDRQAFDLEKYQTQKDELQRQAMLRDPEKAYLISNEEFDKRLDELGWKPKDLMAIAGMYAERAGYQFGQKVREAFRTFLETLFQAASLTIDTVRTFFLIVLALLGPVAFAFSVYDGFHNTGVLAGTLYLHLFVAARQRPVRCDPFAHPDSNAPAGHRTTARPDVHTRRKQYGLLHFYDYRNRRIFLRADRCVVDHSGRRRRKLRR